MHNFEVVMVYPGAHTGGRLDVRMTKMFVIQYVTHKDRQALRQVLNSDDFRNMFGVDGSTQESRIVLYYRELDPTFEQMFDELFKAVQEAIAANEPALPPG